MAGRAGAVVGARRRAREQRARAGRGYDRTRPPVYLSQQRVGSHPERFQALAPVTVSAFLEGYGYETRADTDMWLVRPGVSTTPTLSFDVSGHEERGGHTWYQLKVCLEVSAAPALRWTSERRLSTLREELHDRVKDVLGQNYAAHFSKTPFALKGTIGEPVQRLDSTGWCKKCIRYSGNTSMNRGHVCLACFHRLFLAPCSELVVCSAFRSSNRLLLLLQHGSPNEVRNEGNEGHEGHEGDESNDCDESSCHEEEGRLVLTSAVRTVLAAEVRQEGENFLWAHTQRPHEALCEHRHVVVLGFPASGRVQSSPDHRFLFEDV
eukprot:s4048_g1.t1